VVCDNASSDNSINEILLWAKKNFLSETLPSIPIALDKFIKKKKKRWDFTLLRINTNIGYSGGNNIGIRYALSDNDFAYILLLNNDTVLHHNALHELASCAETNPNFGILGSTILYYCNPDLVQCAGGCTYNSITTIFKNKYSNLSLSEVLDKKASTRLDYIHGAASLFRSEVFRRFGYLDERYFLYYEELDFSRRLIDSKYSLGWCKKSLIFHKGAVSTGGRAYKTNEESYLSNYHENLSTLLYTKKHHSHYFIIPAILRLFGKSWKYIYSRRTHLFPALYCAYKDFFFTKHRRSTTNNESNTKVLFLGNRKSDAC
jgi:GT2 family glycosyltransferase